MRETPVLHPSLDLLGGKLAVLERGELLALADLDPRARAASYARHGVLNVIDLDAALGHGANTILIEELCRQHPCYVGGGLRTPEDALSWLRAGARKVIFGSAPFSPAGLDHAFLVALARRVPPERIVFALDTRAGAITTGAWTRSTGFRVEDVVGELEPFCSEFILTSIEREDRAAGPDLDAIAHFSALTRRHLQAAGGVATVAHVKALAALGVSPVLSRALHRDELDLSAAFRAMGAPL
jgi:phosphoribosylformimino-5-aminoimidazole carboxamide ribonucleotide (ProFAR) isomerase